MGFVEITLKSSCFQPMGDNYIYMEESSKLLRKFLRESFENIIKKKYDKFEKRDDSVDHPYRDLLDKPSEDLEDKTGYVKTPKDRRSDHTKGTIVDKDTKVDENDSITPTSPVATSMPPTEYIYVKRNKTYSLPEAIVGGPYKSARLAKNAADKLDNKYGSYVHQVVRSPTKLSTERNRQY